ncbi:MAG: hypothetical protein R2695_18860 [Acidimicrobiales bacterium]
MSGRFRLDELARRFGDRIEVSWRAFLLRTEEKATDQAKFVKYTESGSARRRPNPARASPCGRPASRNPPRVCPPTWPRSRSP